MFPEERVMWGEERTLRMEEVVVEYLIVQSRFVLFLPAHSHSDQPSNGFPLSKKQHVYSKSIVPHGPIWEFVSEQNYLPQIRVSA